MPAASVLKLRGAGSVVRSDCACCMSLLMEGREFIPELVTPVRTARLLHCIVLFTCLCALHKVFVQLLLLNKALPYNNVIIQTAALNGERRFYRHVLWGLVLLE